MLLPLGPALIRWDEKAGFTGCDTLPFIDVLDAQEKGSRRWESRYRARAKWHDGSRVVKAEAESHELNDEVPADNRESAFVADFTETTVVTGVARLVRCQLF